MSDNTLDLIPNYDVLVDRFAKNAVIEAEALVFELSDLKAALVTSQIRCLMNSMNVAVQSAYLPHHITKIREMCEKIAEMLKETRAGSDV